MAEYDIDEDLHVLPIELGSMLFSITDPHPGREVEYTRWYERDHFFAGGVINPYVFSGQRWVATRDLKEQRYVTAGNPVADDPTRGSYLHLYWILAGANERWRRRNMIVVQRLFDAGRMAGSHRDTVFTINPTVSWSQRRHAEGVPPEMALEHRFPSLHLTFASTVDGCDPAAADEWLRTSYAPTALSPASPLALCVAISPRPLVFEDSLADGLGLLEVDEDDDYDRRFGHLWFSDVPVDDPSMGFHEMAEAFAASGLVQLDWASSFRPAVPGTDRFIDDLL